MLLPLSYLLVWLSHHLFMHPSLATQAVKNPQCKRPWVQSLGWEDPLEKRIATHSSILAWRIPWTEELGEPTVHRVAKSWTQLSD